MIAVKRVGEKKIVWRSCPFQRTTDVGVKFAPVTVSVKLGLPAAAELGNNCVNTGAGLLTVKATTFDAPPPGAGLKTTIGNVPPVATAVAGIRAVNCELKVKLVGTSSPLKRTIDEPVKPEPFTIKSTAPVPATVVSGLMLVIRGAGLTIWNGKGLAAPPPGAGFKTETCAVPPAAR